MSILFTELIHACALIELDPGRVSSVLDGQDRVQVLVAIHEDTGFARHMRVQKDIHRLQNGALSEQQLAAHALAAMFSHWSNVLYVCDEKHRVPQAFVAKYQHRLDPGEAPKTDQLESYARSQREHATHQLLSSVPHVHIDSPTVDECDFSTISLNRLYEMSDGLFENVAFQEPDYFTVATSTDRRQILQVLHDHVPGFRPWLVKECSRSKQKNGEQVVVSVLRTLFYHWYNVLTRFDALDALHLVPARFIDAYKDRVAAGVHHETHLVTKYRALTADVSDREEEEEEALEEAWEEARENVRALEPPTRDIAAMAAMAASTQALAAQVERRIGAFALGKAFCGPR